MREIEMKNLHVDTTIIYNYFPALRGVNNRQTAIIVNAVLKLTFQIISKSLNVLDIVKTFVSIFLLSESVTKYVMNI